MRWFEFKRAKFPRWYLRVGRLAVLWWPNAPLLMRLEWRWDRG